ncbi:hypothetical protein KY342_00120 [Candidatus Woesearchaeota archaeon]|nr:hypothetical protein [Candidatus Woesearchaeota archaeon]
MVSGIRRNNRKKLKRKGIIVPRLQKVNMPYCKIKSDALEPRSFWDNWTDYRDGWRDRNYKAWKEIDKKKRKKRKKR